MIDKSEMNELRERVEDLLDNQIRDWELVRTNTYALASLKTRYLYISDFPIILQFNPERIRSSAAKTDTASLQARPCFFCHRPEEQYGIDEIKANAEVKEYDVIVAGGGPAGVSAAIYSARKGLRVAIVAERVGGQVKETVGIENLISVPETTGNELAGNLKTHLLRYPVDLLEHRKVEKVEVIGKQMQIITSVGEKFLAPALIIATGASWRKLNVPGEAEYIGRGVAFCPHCDGPFYKGKHVAVVGGGNSGIEAAIDLAGICSKVTVFEFMDELKADSVLQDRLKSLPNVEVFVSSQTTEVIGNGDKLTALRIKDRKTEEERLVELDGVFVQIGLSANSSVFRDIVETNRPGEIMIDAHCRTNVTGIYAAGDVSTVPYKQIIISMGEGAKAALSAFYDRVRGII